MAWLVWRTFDNRWRTTEENIEWMKDMINNFEWIKDNVKQRLMNERQRRTTLNK